MAFAISSLMNMPTWCQTHSHWVVTNSYLSSSDIHVDHFVRHRPRTTVKWDHKKRTDSHGWISACNRYTHTHTRAHTHTFYSNYARDGMVIGIECVLSQNHPGAVTATVAYQHTLTHSPGINLGLSELLWYVYTGIRVNNQESSQ